MLILANILQRKEGMGFYTTFSLRDGYLDPGRNSHLFTKGFFSCRMTINSRVFKINSMDDLIYYCSGHFNDFCNIIKNHHIF